jgi:LmbE family N-acetylglucosaminyl deacetylase
MVWNQRNGSKFLLMTIPLSGSDRVLFFAPHPDDEGLAAAGLLQRVALMGARAHLVFVTNGDNNVWAQRFLERRWRITESDRLRWGELRKQEVRAAAQAMELRKRGGLRFLNLPDQEITSLLRKVPARLSAILREEIDQFKPTLIVAPSIYDAHPDHSALSVAISLALERSGHPSTPCYYYIVHRPQKMPASPSRQLNLTETERRRKRATIECYRSQLHLFPERFTRFAQPIEVFYQSDRPETAAAQHGFAMSNGPLHLNLEISAPELLRRAREVLFVFSPFDADPITWRVSLRFRNKPFVLEDGGTGAFLRQIEGERKLNHLRLSLPLALLPESQTGYLKIVARTLFFDRFGWFKIALPSRTEEKVTPGTRETGPEQFSLSETPLDPEAP